MSNHGPLVRLLLPCQLMASTTIRKTSLAQHTKDPKCGPHTDKTNRSELQLTFDALLPKHCPMDETGFDLSSAWRSLESGEARNSVAPWFSKTTRSHRDPCLTDGARNHERHCCYTSAAEFSQTDCFPHFATTLTN